MELKRAERKIVALNKVRVWDQNPRHIREEGMDRLKSQILELGQYKPLICFEENGDYIALGGNQRLKALVDLGVKKVEINVVEPKSEAQKIEYALSDNDRAGEYDEQALAELVTPYVEQINLEQYKVDLAEPVTIGSVVDFYGPDFTDPEIDPSGQIEGFSKDSGDYILFNFENKEKANKAREILGLHEKYNTMDGEVLLELLRKSSVVE